VRETARSPQIPLTPAAAALPAAHLRRRIHDLTITTKTNHLRSKTQYSQKPLLNPLTNLQLSES
jgi:hypothetical protein